MTRRPRAISLSIVGIAIALVAPGGADAANNNPAVEPFAPPTLDCSVFPEAPDGSRRQSFDAVEDVGGIAALPPRIVTEVDPGESTSYCIGFQNRSGEPLDLDLDVVDVTADEQGAPSSQRDAEDRGASKWVTLPTTKIRNLPAGDIAWLEVRVVVPGDALAGSSYASILATDATKRASQPGSGVQAVPSIASQLFFDIPGDASRSGKLVDVRSPRLIWWDGFDLARVPVLEKLRGLGIATMRFGWQNSGDFTANVSGQVVIRSDLTNKVVKRIDVKPGVVLRDSTRRFDATWSNDIPFIGRFTPTVELTGVDGRPETHELPAIWVIPSWWYLLALALAIALPLWWRRRSRRRYEALLARVEAAEARGAADGDESSWEPGDEWSGDRR